LENCIPLCFECHGEVEAYNTEHPIGTKYTARELKRRRDDWYERVKSATPTALDARHAEIDRKLLSRLCRKCPPHVAKAFFHEQLYSASFPQMIVQVLTGLHSFGEEVESQFLDPDLESLFADLRAKVREMLKALSHADAVGEHPTPIAELLRQEFSARRAVRHFFMLTARIRWGQPWVSRLFMT